MFVVAPCKNLKGDRYFPIWIFCVAQTYRKLKIIEIWTSLAAFLFLYMVRSGISLALAETDDEENPG